MISDVLYFVAASVQCFKTKQKFFCFFLFQKHVECEMAYPTIGSRIETRFIKCNMLMYNVNESSKSNIKNINNSCCCWVSQVVYTAVVLIIQ